MLFIIWASTRENLSSGFPTKKVISACSATETSKKIENLLVTNFDMILSNKQIKNALIRLHGYAGWSAPLLFANTEDRVSGVEANVIPY